MEQLKDRVAVVTGAASGIGLGITEALASHGAKVMMADVEEPVLLAQAERLSKANLDVTPCVTDVRNAAALDALRDRAIARYGIVHIVCNNAGVAGGGAGPLWEKSERDWAWVMGVNFYGIVNGCRAFLPHMIGHGEEGHIVNTSSILGLTGGAGSIYGVSKHAVTRFTEGLYHDLAAAGGTIGASVLCPGLIATNIVRSYRNRPVELANEASGQDAASEELISERDRYFKEQGMDPRRVGDMVVDAMRERRFYILTHPENMQGVTRRFEDILNLRPPSLGATL